ncbi:Cthe_2314 family HEPN domain-containing protein [Paenibacillus flagellatus]|uniref:Cthe_2314 family HEPN domain-containing protein n=1 Tax=Paenibacillus flagellatus TaxID=2211139 RepID=UPI0011B4277A|nr:Cthe_2314 family HEPN domain-containing protein [Paenibacillus flagellatus]
MFRAWFDEPKRTDAGPLLDAVTAIGRYRKLLTGLIERQTPECGRYTRYELWARGLTNALDELEQSVYCAARFRESVTRGQEEKMTPEERDDYRRHVYFYKNGLIRLFSILDKLGYFLNDLLKLKSERVKNKFSYFTVLRQMQHLHAEPGLCEPLQSIKNAYREPLARLREKRNMEIHLVNTEMLDDLLHIDLCRADRTYIEDLSANMDDLRQGMDMVCRTLATVFDYVHDRKKT